LTELQDDLNDAFKDQKSADEALQKLNAEAAKLAAAAKAAKQANKEESHGTPASSASTSASAPASAAASAPASASASAPAAAAASKSAPAYTTPPEGAGATGTQLQGAIDKVAHERGENSADYGWLDRLAENLKGKGRIHSDIPWLDEAIKHAVNNPELALYKLKNTTYKYSFMLVPISLPFLWLMFFWRRGFAMFDHAVFVLYSLCFMSLLFDCVMLAGMAGWAVLAANLAVFVPPVHMFVQLRGAYGLGIFSALWRTFALTIVATIVLVLFMLMVLALSMH